MKTERAIYVTFIPFIITMMDIWSDYQLNIFIATGNADKAKRVSSWLPKGKYHIVTLNDLSPELAAQIKTTDEEEKKFGHMYKRALGKVKKAAKALPKDTNIVILATDDTAYLPEVDAEIVDLRTPPAIFKDKKQLLPAVEGRLSGKELANYYANLTNLAVKEPKKGFDYKFMPLVWKFALAAAPAGKPRDAAILTTWAKEQFVRGVLLEGEVEDTGYMMDKVTSDKPDGDLNSLNKGKWDETVPKRALLQYLSLYNYSK
jgi:hypothetical protein